MLDCGISPEYVLDKMRYYEISALLRNSHMRHREQWEMTRLLSYFVAQVNSTTTIDIKKIIPFRWDDKQPEAEKVTEEDKRELTEKLNQFIREKNGD